MAIYCNCSDVVLQVLEVRDKISSQLQCGQVVIKESKVAVRFDIDMDPAHKALVISSALQMVGLCYQTEACCEIMIFTS